MLATIPVAALRWHILLRSQGLALHLWHTMRIVAMGAFFATFLPGSAGGDLVRGVYIYQASHGRRTSALLSIFIDRLIGLTAFVIFGVARDVDAAAREAMASSNTASLRLPRCSRSASSCSFASAIASPSSSIACFAGRSQRIAAIIDDAGEALASIFAAMAQRSALPCCISLLIVFVIAVTVVRDRGRDRVRRSEPVEYGIAGVYAMIANSLPFTPGGLGIGEGAFASACVALEPAITGIPYGTIFLVLRCVVVLSTLPGLIVYLVYPQRATLLALGESQSLDGGPMPARIFLAIAGAAAVRSRSPSMPRHAHLLAADAYRLGLATTAARYGLIHAVGAACAGAF